MTATESCGSERTGEAVRERTFSVCEPVAESIFSACLTKCTQGEAPRGRIDSCSPCLSLAPLDRRAGQMESDETFAQRYYQRDILI